MPEYVEPTESQKFAMYEIYKLIHSSHFSPAKKRSVMTATLGYETWSWRVVGITEEAIKAIARNNYRKPSGVLARDHTHPRSETYKAIFDEAQKPLSFEDWWSIVWENDKTVLMTHDEHRDRVPESRIVSLDPRKGYFIDAEVAGWHQTQRHEGALIRQLVMSENIDLN